MEKLYQIYLITNSINNKKYIGQVIKHRGYLARFNQHIKYCKFSNSYYLSAAIQKYNKENFYVELIEDNIPESLIDDKEKYYIKYFDTYYQNKKGYNMTFGGQGTHGYKFTKKDRLKASESCKAKWQKLKADTELYLSRNKKISDSLKGIQRTEQTKKKLSEIAKKRFENEPGTFTGRKHSKKTKMLIAQKNGHPVGMYDKETGELLKTFISTMEASRYLCDNNLTQNKRAYTRIITICKGIKGQGKTAYGYIWKYLK